MADMAVLLVAAYEAFSDGLVSVFEFSTAVRLVLFLIAANDTFSGGLFFIRPL